MNYLILEMIFGITLLILQNNSYQTNKLILNKFDLNNLFHHLKINTNWKKLSSKAIQTIATELYGSYESFFILIKKDKTARPPRKIEYNYYHTLTYNQSGNGQIKNNLLYINKISFDIFLCSHQFR